jgi:phosphomannomutase
MVKTNSVIFKANDIRGKYPSEINKEIVFNIVSSIKNIFKKTVVVGYDARLSSPELYESVLAALKLKEGIKNYSGWYDYNSGKLFFGK